MSAAVLAVALLALHTWYLGPYGPGTTDPVTLLIPRGASPAQVSRLLAGEQLIRSERAFRVLAWIGGDSGRLQAGEYRFEPPLRPAEVLSKIVSGDVLLHKITIPEGLAGAGIARRLEEAGISDGADLASAFRETGSIADWDPEADDLEGYLFPDTYHFARGSSAAAVYGEMVRRFREEFDGALRARAEELGLSIREATTLASLIEKETSVPEERTRISAVFHNRLRIGMALQCDPTVIFALQRQGRYEGRLTKQDLEFDSPYNTYQYPGLPPGPIASPGGASIEAAVHPSEHRDLYFVADGTGGHSFSRTLQEHLRAVERYRRLRKRGA